MKIACVILGTRGDVQPMVALATGLRENAVDLAHKLQNKNGVEMTVQLIEKEFKIVGS